MTKKGVEAKVEVPVAEKVAAEVNAPLHVEKLFSGVAHVCEPCGRVLGLQKPGEGLKTMGGEALDAVPECPGVGEGEHGPWPAVAFDLASVSINKATGRAVGGVRVK